MLAYTMTLNGESIKGSNNFEVINPATEEIIIHLPPRKRGKWFGTCPLGASVDQRPPTENVERFLLMLGFDSRGKLNPLGCYADPKAIETGIEQFASLQVLIAARH